MTTPDPLDPQEAADVLAAYLFAVTARAVGPVSEALQHAVQVLIAALAAQWVLDFGAVDATPADTAAVGPFVDRARLLIERVDLPPAAQAALETATGDAYRYGVGHAGRFTPPDALRSTVPPDRPLPDLAAILDEQRAHALRGLDERVLAERGFPAVVQSTAKLQRAASRIEANAAYETTLAANTGVRDSTPPGWSVVWVAERDACLTCLAYAGVTTPPGTPFPEGLTFGNRPMSAHEPLLGPPRHPHCRCTLQPLHPDDTAVPEGLKREARRSVLRGWADDDSEKAKLRAAERLLVVGAVLPKSVEARAARAVRDARFN